MIQSERNALQKWLHKHKHLWEPLHERRAELLLEIECERNIGSMGGDKERIRFLEQKAHQAMIECAQVIIRITELQTQPDPLIIKIEDN